METEERGGQERHWLLCQLIARMAEKVRCVTDPAAVLGLRKPDSDPSVVYRRRCST